MFDLSRFHKLIRNRILWLFFLVLIIFAVVAFLGISAVRNVPIDAFPDVTPAQVNIYTESPGLAAEDCGAGDAGA